MDPLAMSVLSDTRLEEKSGRSGPTQPQMVDLVVVGAGISGLLMAAYATRAGSTALVLERRRIPGGRFSGELVAGAQISTGALHVIPHGSRGPLSQALAELSIDQPIIDSEILCSVWSPQGHVIWAKPHHFFTRILPLSELLKAIRFYIHLKSDRDFEGTVEDWARLRGMDGSIYQLLRAAIDFGLGIRPDQLSWKEFREVMKSFRRFGGPGVPRGGSRSVAERLTAYVRQKGGAVLLQTEVVDVRGLLDGEQGWLVTYHERGTAETRHVTARTLVATAGADARLSGAAEVSDVGTEPACGFKLQLLLPFSVVSHNGIMFCTGTRKISGLAQLSNADPSLAPAGMHLVNTFHACGHDANPAEERSDALRDLEMITGRQIANDWILSAAIYRGRWPVNRSQQGRELSRRIGTNFYRVGDACKPSGLIMVEGAAESARELAASLGFRGAYAESSGANLVIGSRSI